MCKNTVMPIDNFRYRKRITPQKAIFVFWRQQLNDPWLHKMFGSYHGGHRKHNKMYGPTSGQIYCRPPGQLVFWLSNPRGKWRSHMKPKSMNTLVSAPFKHWESAPSIWEGSEFRVEANVFTKFWNVGSVCVFLQGHRNFSSSDFIY